jgi:ribosomal protein S18 acetylase RimI-like enzyme
LLTIRKATEQDFDAIWKIFSEVVSHGDTYAYSPETTREEAHEIWLTPKITTYVACNNDDIVGTYILRPNHPGLGSHVANAGYMVRGDMQGQGIGRVMCEHSLQEAKTAGFEAMQFNLVVSTNEGAVKLWQKLGFAVVATLPKAFRHREFGLVDAFIMYRLL